MLYKREENEGLSPSQHARILGAKRVEVHFIYTCEDSMRISTKHCLIKGEGRRRDGE
jgi:hypothetical protein